MPQHVDISASPQNIRAIWDQIRGLRTDLAAAQATITAQQSTIAEQAATIVSQQQQIQQALITAGKATAAATTNNSTGDGGGGGSTDSHPNHYSTVVDAKAELVALGEDLSGSCGAFKITRKVAQMLAPSEPDSGLLDKPTGNNCMGYAVDIICYNDGIIYDILGDAGGANDPQWNFGGSVDPSRWRASF